MKTQTKQLKQNQAISALKTSTLLTVVIPVYNEENNIAELVRRVQAVALDKELILVDDASTDQTLNIIERDVLGQYDNVRLLKHDKNQGKGAAIRTGLAAIRGHIVIIQDADLEYSPQDYPALIKPILEGRALVVYGSRFGHVNKVLFVWHWFLNRFFGRHYEIRYLHHFVGIQVLNLLANLLYNAKTSDEATCYKVFKSEVLQGIRLKCNGFDFCPEITAKVRKKGIPIVEVPIQYHPRSKKEGKKLNWTHGFEAIWTLLKYRFVD